MWVITGRSYAAATPGRGAGRLGAVPELPEVETIRRDLEPLVVGRTVAAAVEVDPGTIDLLTDLPIDALRAGLVGRRFVSLGRRGKYLLFGIDDGRTFVTHLRMTGRLVWRGARDPAIEYERGAHRARRGTRPALERPAQVRHLGHRRGSGGGGGEAGAGAAGCGVHGGLPAEPAGGADGSREGSAARPAADSGAGEHLRGRGALPGAHPAGHGGG